MPDSPSVDKVIIANASGFYGDRRSAPEEMVRGGPIDVLTGDYLAELTMAILARQRMKDPKAGYVPTFLRQMESILGECLSKSIKIVTNAGGLSPKNLARDLGALAERLGLRPKIAIVEGDDLMGRLADLEASGEPLAHLETGVPLTRAPGAVLTANAYLGGFGICEALNRGADIVICGRVTDAALVVGPAAHKLGLRRDDWDRLAAAVAAGHILECSSQATGGNYAFFKEVPSFKSVGFPIAEIFADGSFVITKHPGTGGLVSVGTVTAQLLYEIQGAKYLSPDVTAHFDSLSLAQEGPDRVRVTGARGSPPPPTSKVSACVFAGYRNSMTVLLSGLHIEEKAALVERTLFEMLGGRDRFSSTDVRLVHATPVAPKEPGQLSSPPDEGPLALLTISVASSDPALAGKRFSAAIIEMALASIPGFTVMAPPDDAKPAVLNWPALLPARHLKQVVQIEGETIEVEEAAQPQGATPPEAPQIAPDTSAPTEPEEPAVSAPVGEIFGARSGDKGGDANLGVWATTPAAFAFLRRFLSTEKLTELLPSTAGLRIERCELPNLLAVNFVIKGLLGQGAGTSARMDPQAKALAELFRSRIIRIPASLMTSIP
jgi:hypothetical protein